MTDDPSEGAATAQEVLSTGARFDVLEKLYTQEQRQAVLRGTRAADALARSQLRIRGPIHWRDGELYAGDFRIAGDTEIVDLVKEETGFGCTIFRENVRIATNAIAEGGSGRALGTQTNDEVTEKVYRGGETFLGVTRTIGKDWVIRYSPLRTEGGEIVGMIATYYEQTAFQQGLEFFRARLEEAERASLRVDEQALELARKNEELERSNRLKDEFLANMSHELRTPLNSILGICESLDVGVYGELGERQSRVIGSVARSGEHLLALINDLLDLSKIDAGRERLRLASTRLQRLCSQSLEIVSEQASQKGLSLEFEFEATQERVEADPRRLKQVLVNLLANAVKFTSAGSVGLKVRDAEDASFVELEVWDTGIGIRPEDQERVFEAFTQVEGGDTRSYEGTGLGLALVSRLVSLHGGTVALQSEVGRGSCFTIRLPWGGNDGGEASRVQGLEGLGILASQAVPRSDSPLILIVDDSQENVAYIQDYLEFRGYRVESASDGRQGVERTRELRPAAILMDVQMPVMDGLEATRQLRASPETREVRIIALTARAMPRDREECLAAGADAYLAKPVVLEQLAGELERLLHVQP